MREKERKKENILIPLFCLQSFPSVAFTSQSYLEIRSHCYIKSRKRKKLDLKGHRGRYLLYTTDWICITLISSEIIFPAYWSFCITFVPTFCIDCSFLNYLKEVIKFSRYLALSVMSFANITQPMASFQFLSMFLIQNFDI